MTTERIRELNDEFRKTFEPGNKVVLTCGVADNSPETIQEIVKAVKLFKDFNDGNDPFGEHDFGAFDINDEKYFWKIDYYDNDLKYGSEDPANPEVTTRVLTIMMAAEY